MSNEQADVSIDRFDEDYRQGADWDIGVVQPALKAYLTERKPVSTVLEVGCGTGELAAFVASLGCQVQGIDFSSEAIAIAKARHSQTGCCLDFQVADIFNMALPSVPFGSVIDCCFFHMWSDENRTRYRERLTELLVEGGDLYLLNFAIDLPTPNAPRAVTKDVIKQFFDQGWSIEHIQTSSIEVSWWPEGMPATLAHLRRC